MKRILSVIPDFVPDNIIVMTEGQNRKRYRMGRSVEMENVKKSLNYCVGREMGLTMVSFVGKEMGLTMGSL